MKETFLLVVDTNFDNVCDEPQAYLSKLTNVIKKNHGEDSNIVTISGKRGLLKVDPNLPYFEVDERNKTVFKESIEEVIGKFDYLVLISINGDNFIENCNNLCREYKKTVINYGYKPRNIYE